jgi:hypothetical protein
MTTWCAAPKLTRHRRRLPERVRPSLFAFGTLADGYVPFAMPDGSEQTIGLTSVVMKVRAGSKTLLLETRPCIRSRVLCVCTDAAPCHSAAIHICAAGTWLAAATACAGDWHALPRSAGA